MTCQLRKAQRGGSAAMQEETEKRRWKSLSGDQLLKGCNIKQQHIN
jgi:hypothetical protein